MKKFRVAQNKVIKRQSADLVAPQTTISTTGHVGDGLACTAQQGKFNTTVDMRHAIGSSALGSSSGFFACAAIIGCVAIATKMTAAREGLAVHWLDVKIETYFDDLAIYVIGSRKSALTETRITLVVSAAEADHIIPDLVERTLASDLWFLAPRDAQIVVVDTRIAGQKATTKPTKSD